MNSLIKIGTLGALVIFAILIYSTNWQRKLSEKGIIPDQYRFGDLYNTSNLTRVKELDFYEADNVPLSQKPTKVRNTMVSILGDSFTGMGIDTSLLAGEENYRRWLNNDSFLTVKIDTNKYNVLIFEIVQRSLIERLNPHTEHIYFNQGIKTLEQPAPHTLSTVTNSPSLGSLGLKFLSAESVNQRIEFLLFNQKWALKWKEFKAELHADLFNRVVGKAVLTEDKKNMYYDFETDTTNFFSSYYPVKNNQIDTIVVTLNSIRSHYLKMGFDEVLLTIIPNKSLIFEPNRLNYNRIIERIQQHPDLEMPYINMHELLKNKPEFYHKGDGHWNNKGKMIWLNQVNTWIRTHAPAAKNQV